MFCGLWLVSFIQVNIPHIPLISVQFSWCHNGFFNRVHLWTCTCIYLYKLLFVSVYDKFCFASYLVYMYLWVVKILFLKFIFISYKWSQSRDMYSINQCQYSIVVFIMLQLTSLLQINIKFREVNSNQFQYIHFNDWYKFETFLTKIVRVNYFHCIL